MSYKIIGDSCLDIPIELKKDGRFQIIPLTLQVGDHVVVDDDSFDQKSFLELVKTSPDCPKTACPSPEAFKKAYQCPEEDIYVITLSGHLSGTYNSARVAQELYEEEFGPKNILVIDSESASAGETNLALWICDMYDQGLSFTEISEKVLAMRDIQKTYFVIDTLEPLRKNGRLTGLQAFFATALNIKPIMGADHGVIIKVNQARGLNKAYGMMCDIAVKEAGETSDKRAVITHVNCRERAEQVKRELLKLASFAEIVIADAAGVATVYAADGGVILAVV